MRHLVIVVAFTIVFTGLTYAKRTCPLDIDCTAAPGQTQSECTRNKDCARKERCCPADKTCNFRRCVLGIIDPCRTDSCPSGKVCVVTASGVFQCQSPCDSTNTCNNGGTCSKAPSVSGNVCYCPEGYTGDYCEDGPDAVQRFCPEDTPCLPDSMQMPGLTCTSDSDCQATEACCNGVQSNGDPCIGACVNDPCATVTCPDGKTCVVTSAGYQCKAPCNSANPCQNGGTCSNNVCTCPETHTGDYCEEALDGCPTPPAVGLCEEECSQIDDTCPAGQKCCSNGCGHECKDVPP